MPRDSIDFTIEWERFIYSVFNPNLVPIFTYGTIEIHKNKYDYSKIKEDMKKSGFAEELMAYIFHPRNMGKWKDWGFEEHQEFMNFIND